MANQKKQENQEDLLGQSACDRVVFCFFCFLVSPREGCRELSLVIYFFSCQSMHMSKKRMCKEECKKRTLTAPCSGKKCMYIFYIYARACVCMRYFMLEPVFLMFLSHSYVGESERRGILNHVQFHATILV